MELFVLTPGLLRGLTFWFQIYEFVYESRSNTRFIIFSSSEVKVSSVPVCELVHEVT